MPQLAQESSTLAWLAAYGDAQAPPTAASRRTLGLLAAPSTWKPAQSECCRVIFDGVLHNRAELRDRFAQQLPRSASDADLIWHAYQVWGADAVAHLRGQYALLIWDSAQDLLLCARDPLGMHPLFYTEVGRSLLLSPSIQSLIAQPGVSPALNRPALVEHLMWRWLGLEETYFEHVRRVPPGHVLRVDRHGRQVYRYWDPAPLDRPVDWIPDDEAQERFDALLQQAVGRSLALGTAGIFLSGGLDSVSVAAVAAELCGRDVRTAPLALAMGFEGADCDEQEMQRAVAVRLGLPSVFYRFYDAAGPDGYLPTVLELSGTLPAPLYDLFGAAYTNLAYAGRQQGCRVILTGEGGDEWLGVRPAIAADLCRTLDLRGLQRLWQTDSRSYPVARWLEMRELLWRYGVRPLLRDAWGSLLTRGASHGWWGGLGRRAQARWRQRHAVALTASIPAWLAPDPALREAASQRLAEAWLREQAGSTKGSHYQRDVWRRLNDPLECQKIEELFLQGCQAGVTIQHPLHDPDLVDLMVRIRPEVRNRGGLSKALVRQSLAARLPELGFERQRKGAHINFYRTCIADEVGGARQVMGRLRALDELGVVDADRANAFLDDPVGQDGLRGLGGIWQFLNLEAWVRAHHGAGG